jgi:hypothetical protein
VKEGKKNEMKKKKCKNLMGTEMETALVACQLGRKLTTPTRWKWHRKMKFFID